MSYAACAGSVAIAASVGLRSCDKEPNDSAGRHVSPQAERRPPIKQKAGRAIAVSLLGSIRYKEIREEFPPGPWFGKVADPFDRDSEFVSFPDEVVAAWEKPSVYWGDRGEIVHVAFRRGAHDTVNLDGMAEEKLRDQSGLAIVRAGIPQGIEDIQKLNSGILQASVEYWEQGGRLSKIELEISPVIGEVLFARESSATRDPQWVGRQIPMLLVKVGYPYGGDDLVGTGTKIDRAPPGSRVRREWSLVPYSPDGKAPPELRGETVFDEPLRSAWEAIHDGDAKGDPR